MILFLTSAVNLLCLAPTFFFLIPSLRIWNLVINIPHSCVYYCTNKIVLWLETFWLPGTKVENPNSAAVSPCSWALHRSLAHQQAPCPLFKCPAALIHVLSRSCHSSFGASHVYNYFVSWVRLLGQLKPEHQSPLQWSSACGRAGQDRTRSGAKGQQVGILYFHCSTGLPFQSKASCIVCVGPAIKKSLCSSELQ